MPSDQVNIKIGFTVDKAGLQDLQSSLTQITKTSALAELSDKTGKVSESMLRAGESAQQLKSIVASSWNSQLNQLDLTRFNQQLDQSGINLTQFKQDCYSLGAQGVTAFNKMAMQIGGTTTQLRQSNKMLDQMADTLGKTVRWTMASSAIRKVTSSIREAWNFTKDLDESLNDIRIVTGKSADKMAEFAEQANNAAKALGATTTDYTNASLIFYQQGLSDEEVQARAEVVTKVANVTGQAASEVADNLTAVWNGYQVTAEAAESSIDILAAVAANTASNLEELSTGMTKVAAAANEMGVGEAQLASQISTIVSTTRQAPETVGQALKTIYARMSTISAGGEDEDDGATLTSYTAKMDKFGISVLDANGHLRDMGDVIEEIGEKWDTFSRESQVTLAQTIAGTRQYVNAMALFENWDQYTETLEIAENSQGTLQEQQDIYMDSTEAHLQQMTATAESLYMTLFDTSAMNKMIDALTEVINIFDKFSKSLGGGMQSLVNYALILANLFSTQIAKGIAKSASGATLLGGQAKAVEKQLDRTIQLYQDSAKQARTGTAQERMEATATTKGLESMATTQGQIKGVLNGAAISQEDYDLLMQYSNQIAALKTDISLLEQQSDANRQKQYQSNTEAETSYAEQLDEEKRLLDVRQKGADLSRFEIELTAGYAEAIKNRTAEDQAELEIIDERVNAANEEVQAAEAESSTIVTSENGEKQILITMTDRLAKAQANLQVAREEQAAKQAQLEADKTLKLENDDLVKMRQLLVALTKDDKNLTKEQTAELNEALKILEKTNLTQEEFTRLSKIITNANKESVNLAKIHRDNITELNAALNNTNALNNRKLEADKADLALIEGQFDALMKQKTLTKELSAAFSGMTGLMVSIPQLQNIGNTLTDQSLSAWDKFGQLSMSISFTIPMLTRGFKGMSSTFQTLAKGIQANKALPGLKADLDATTKSIENTTKGLQGYVKADNAYQKGYIKQQGKHNFWMDEATYKRQQQKLEKLTAQQTKQQTDLAATEAQKITGFGNMSLAASLGVFAGIAVAAAVAAVAIYQGVRAYNEWSRAAENAALAAENLQDAADNAASACDSLQSSIDSYEDAIDTLNECTQGTEEWTDALKDANSAAQDLLSTLADVSLSGDEIRGLYSRENGLIVIDEDALSDIMTKQEAQVQAATMAAASGSNYATQIQIQSDLVDAARRAIRQDYVGGMGVGYNPQTGKYDYTVTGKMLGEMIDTNIEAFIGFDGTVWDAADMLKELIPACGSLSDDALVDLAEEVLDLANTMDAATATLKANMDYIITAMYGDTVSDYEAELASREATAFQQSLEDAWNNYLAGNPLSDVEKQLLQESGVSADVLDKTINRWTGKNSDQYTEILSLLQDAGYNYSSAGNAVRKSGEDRIFVFTDRDTHEEVEMYSEEIAATLAATAAVEALDDTIENASDIIKTINNNFGGEDDTNGLNTLIEDYITNGNLNNASNTQINALQDLLLGENNEGIEGIGSALADYLTTIGLSEEDITKIFDFEDFENQMANYLEGYKAAFQEISDAALTSFAEGMDDLSLEQVGAVNDMINDLQSAYEGTDAFDDIVDVLNEVGESDEVSGFVDALGSLKDSWGTVSMSEFTDALENNGVELEDITNDQLAAFVGALNNMAKEMEEATRSLEETTKSINDLVDGLEYGSTLSEDDYNDLIALDSGMSQFFAKNMEGEYAMIASAEKFADYVNNYLLDLFSNEIAQSEEQQNNLEEWFGPESNYWNENVKDSLTSVANSYEDAWDTAVENVLNSNLYDPSIEAVKKLNEAQEGMTSAQQNYDDKLSEYNKLIAEQEKLQAEQADEQITTDRYSEVQSQLNEIDNLLNGETGTWGVRSGGIKDDLDELEELLNTAKDTYNEALEAYNTSENYFNKIVNSENEEYLNDALLTDEALQKSQLDFLTLYQDATGNIIENFEELADDPEALAKATQDAYEDLEKNYDKYIQEREEYQAGLRDQIAASATSIDELNQYLNEGRITLEEYNKYFENLYNQERYADLDTEEIQNYAKYLQGIAEDCDDLANSLADDSDAAYGVAAAIMRMNNGVETLQDNYEDWIDILEKSSKSSYEYAEALMGVTSSLSDILDISEDFISASVVTDNLDDIALAAEGDEDAIDRLRAAALEEIKIQVNLDFNKDYGAEHTLSEIQNYLDANLLEVGATMTNLGGTDEYINALNDIIDATGKTEEEVTAMLAGMGYDVEFDPDSEIVESEYPQTVTHNVVRPMTDEDGTGITGGYDVYSWSEVVGYDEIPTDVANMAMKVTTANGETGGGTVSTKGHVSKITKKPTGSFNNYSSKNAGGNTSEDSGSGSEPSHEDYLEDEIDRYHDIDLQLKKISTSLDRVQKQESKLFGQAYLDNLNEQLALLNEQISATTTKLNIANDELLEYRTKLAAQGVTFDAEGYISNYTAVLSSQLNAVNAMINTYNNMSADEQEAYQDTLDAAKDAYDQLVEDISHYDELLSDTIPGLVDDIADALDQQIEIQITKFTMEVEIRLDMTEAEKDWNTFYRKIILGIDDDDLYGSALENYLNYQSLYNTNNSGVGSIQALTEQVRATYEQLQQYDETGWMSVYGDNYSQALEDLKNYNDQLQDAIIEAKDDIDALWDTYLSEIDAVADAFEDHLDQYEQLADQLDHDLSLIQLLYGDEAYGQMETYYRQIYNNNVNQLSILKDQADFYKNMMDAATDDEEYKKWRDLWEDAIDEVNDMLEDALESAMDLFENTINQMIDEFNKVATNGLGLSFLGDQWDLINDEADIYLDKVNAIYSVQELQNKYLEAIDATDSISAQQKLNALMEEQIGYLTEKENLTQYDIDRAELEYEIMLKQIALEEAQQNKSSMRLRRDAQGNYTYQYVSDEDEIRGLEQELADLQNQLYNLDLDAYKENLNNVYDAYKDLMEELANLDALYRAGDIEDEETYQAERAEIIERYEDIIADYVTEADVARRNLEESFFNELAALYAEDPEVFKAMLDEETLALLDFGDSTGKTRQELYEDAVRAMQNLSDEERELIFNEMIPYANSGIAEMAESLEEFLEIEGNSIEDFFADLMDELAEAETEYEENVDRVLEVSDTAVDELIEGNDSVIDSLNDVIAKTQEQIDIEEEQLQEIKELWDATEDMRQEYALCTDSAVYWAQAAYDYWMAANQMAAEASDSALNAASNYAYATSEVLAYADAVQAAAAAASAAGIGSSSSSSNSSSSSSSRSIGGYNSGGSRGSVNSIIAMASGGYTGTWNTNEGALAILHQKELVLNEDDTANFLKAIEAMRDIKQMKQYISPLIKTKPVAASAFGNKDISSLNQVALDMSNTMSNIIQDYMTEMETALNNIFKSYSDYQICNTKSLDQNVHIEAHFPNVTNSTEIENAFNNLVNVASQYANRTNARR